MDTDTLIDRIIAAKNGDSRRAIAWLIGRVEAEENQMNNIRAALFVEKRQSTVEILSANKGLSESAAPEDCCVCGNPVEDRTRVLVHTGDLGPDDKEVVEAYCGRGCLIERCYEWDKEAEDEEAQE